MRSFVLSAALAALVLAMPQAHALDIPFEQYQLANGLNVLLMPDHSLPQVVTNLWYGVGSKDEVAGRSGFAHLFEHLMFMGTERLPNSGFDDLMEGYGGWNNAWTSEDATDYYDVGPSNLLETFLWMEADRMDGLARAMTQEKLDLQRDVVRNERRQTSEDVPYGVVWLELPFAMYPEGHPYAHTVIGSHEDLQAATVQDVVQFFDTWYVPNNASLVVAGDFDPAQARAAIERSFGGLERKELPPRPEVATPDKPVKPVLELTDEVRVPKLILVWHTPKQFAQGDAELDLLSTILADGRSSRLYKRLVHEGLAVEVEAMQVSQRLSSLFVIEVMPTEGHTLDELQKVIEEELAKMAAEGPSAEELERARNQVEMSFLRRMESLQARASALNSYYYATGQADYAETDLNRYRNASAEGLRSAAALLSVDRRCLVRVTPAQAGATP